MDSGCGLSRSFQLRVLQCSDLILPVLSFCASPGRLNELLEHVQSERLALQEILQEAVSMKHRQPTYLAAEGLRDFYQCCAIVARRGAGGFSICISIRAVGQAFHFMLRIAFIMLLNHMVACAWFWIGSLC